MSTPTLEKVVQDAKRLPLEDQQLLAELIRPPKTIEQLAAEQGIKPFDFAEARRAAVGIWPEDESLDDFTLWLRESRKDRAPEREID
ncbi:MAG: hypothetical protein JST85_22855 [Acidobacteria bacterium]|nr:hypothetical protein [Acidobacteriota bacterium]